MTEATAPAVEARGVSKWFGETTALDAVDFTVKRCAVAVPRGSA